jgi:serine/threonine protein kinase
VVSISSQLFAVKVVKTNTSFDTHEAFQDEVHALQQLSHPNIVNFEELINTQLTSYIIMEVCERGDLRTYLDHVIDTG